MNKKVLFLWPAVVVLMSCTVPQYSIRPYPLTKSPATSERQAFATCTPEAELAAQRDMQTAEQNYAAQRSRIMGYNCMSSYNGGGNSTTDCMAQTQGSGGLAGAYMAEQQVNNTYKNTYDLVLQSCLAKYGWGVESVCVSNCN